jgi:hypothetical protein
MSDTERPEHGPLARPLAERDDPTDADLLRDAWDAHASAKAAHAETVARLIAERDEAHAEADRLHELLRHLHATAASAAHADLIALHIDTRKPRRGA